MTAEVAEIAIGRDGKIPKGPLIFVSHDSRDAELAEAFSKLLSNVSTGLLKSFRSSDNKGSQGLEYGTDWYPEILKKIAASCDVVCLLTARSLNRPWILYEAGVAKGKLDIPVHGLALGMNLGNASTGPFAQFQNCGGDADAITKLVIQLIGRLPDADPDRGLVKAQVEVFRKRVREILESIGEAADDSDGHIEEGSSNARIFEEIKVMFQELPDRIEDIATRNDLGPLRSEVLDPAILSEIASLSAGTTRRPGVAFLVLASPFRDVMPWLYEIAAEIYRAEGRRDLEGARRAHRDFMGALEVSSRLPVQGVRDMRRLMHEVASLAGHFDDFGLGDGDFSAA
ncbi:TIR domain-containing protein [Streptomyces sp. 1331.2]|uniref:TIR domain-containing protein n=1 Tax=Streptomyces sp. 1331.2 TaxID=1938835 RepID=UPI000BD6675E|nr:TIR domain-containing protein [Streptomyces sp. 1331.2]SOB83151.1 TIR domain-containing protein [Streptomyces sp. 1331.2]